MTSHKFNPLSLSMFLAFRYLPDPKVSWFLDKVVTSNYLQPNTIKKLRVKNYQDVILCLTKITNKYQNKKTGVLLSSGIDSAIIAKFLPKNTCAYTVKFEAENTPDEAVNARKTANYLGIKHKVVEVNWSDYQRVKTLLMLHKNSPLHPAEPAIYLASLQAKKDGVDYLFAGSGADATFGGMDKLLSKDWSYQEFVNRYNFLNPKIILEKHSDVEVVYNKYKTKDSIDVIKFLREIFGLGTAQMFNNAIEAAGCKAVTPFGQLYLESELDLSRIRRGEAKYILKEAYENLYPSLRRQDKIPFARPMSQWLAGWKDVRRPEFKKGLNIDALTGEQKWLIYSLQDFMNLIEKENL